MEKSLDELIEHLLGEIAVCGPTGATVSDIVNFVDSFYYHARSPSIDSQVNTQVIDDAFVCAVYRWLGKHPDVSIGKDKEHNVTGLEIHRLPDLTLLEQAATLPRVFVGNERVYQAICGHAPDDKRVFKSEYGLLLHIAAARSEGILQGDLGRAAGQDKRSVPKRTDSLHAKGYIIKETVPFHGHKSSRLTLRRFATAAQVDSSANQSQGPSRHERSVQDVVDDVVAIFARESLLEAETLAKRVNMSNEVAQKTLIKILRPLVRAGFLKKVKAAIGASAHKGEPNLCFQRLRQFSPEDTAGFSDSPYALDQVLQNVLDDEAAQYVTPLAAESDEALVQWHPDRNVANAIQHAAVLAGSKGLTNTSTRQKLTGTNVRRPIESLLVRLSFAGLLSQPPHLRHLSIIRINGSAVGAPEYIHYSLPAVQRIFKQGKLDISSVPGIECLSDNPELKMTGDVDAFGFPLTNSKLLVPNRATTFRECAASANAIDMGGDQLASNSEDTPRCGRARLEPLEAHTRDARKGFTPRNSSTHDQSRKQATRKGLIDSDDMIRGRPRKFLSGTEKFWQHHFWHARVAVEGIPSSRAGTMSHPIGKALFDQRPAQFDQVLVRAKEAGLPLPRNKEDISEEWVEKTLKILDRTKPGVYITPSGMHMSRVLHVSQILIFRSAQLNRLALSGQEKVFSYRFLSTSAAHSFQNWKWNPSTTRPKRKKPTTRNFDVEYPADLLEAFGKLARPAPDIGKKPLTSSRETETSTLATEEPSQLMSETGDDSNAERLQTLPPYTALTSGEKTVNSSYSSQQNTLAQSDGVDVRPLTVTSNDTPSKTIPTLQTAEIEGTHSPLTAESRGKEGITEKAGPNISPVTELPSRSPAAYVLDAANPSGATTVTDGHNDRLMRREQPSPGISSQTDSNFTDQPHLALTLKLDAAGKAAFDGSPAGPMSVSSSQKRKATDMGSETAEERRPTKLLKPTQRTQPSIARFIVMKLLEINEGIGPGNPNILRKSFRQHWQEEGFQGLPNLTTVKRAVESLVQSGQVKQHTFSFRSSNGLMVSRSMLYPPTRSLTDERFTKLKEAIIEAGLNDYFPPSWIVDSPVSPAPAPQSPDTPVESDAELDIPEVELPAVRTPRSARRRPSRRGSSPGAQTTDNSVGSPEPTGSRSPSISDSSTGIEAKDAATVGFLTLKVPRLGTLPEVQRFNAVKTVPAHLTVSNATPPTRPKRPPKPRSRKPKAQSLRKVLWKNSRLPTSLRAILDEQVEHDPSQAIDHGGDPDDVFYQEVLLVSKWEERLKERLVETKIPWTFIDHFCNISTAPCVPFTDSWEMLEPDLTGILVGVPAPEPQSWPPFVKVLEKSRLVPGLGIGSIEPVSVSTGRVTRQGTGSLQRKRAFDFGDDDVGTPSKRARRTVDLPFEDDGEFARGKRRRGKRPKHSDTVENSHAALLSRTAKDDIFRIAVSVVLVGTLIGGPEWTINWNIVSNLHPGVQRAFLTSRWKAIEKVYPSEIAVMTSTLRREYIDAVESEQVPLVNLSNQGDSAWSEILTWALNTLPSFIQENELAASRSELESQYILKLSEPVNVRPLFAPHVAFRTNEREEVVSSSLHSSVLRPNKSESGEIIAAARSAIISSLLTEPFSPGERTRAQTILERAGGAGQDAEQTVATAMQQLLDEGIIAKTNPAVRRIQPLIEDGSRAYMVTDKMTEVLVTKRIVTWELLDEATRYKLEVLDESFAADEAVCIANQEKLSNGQMVTILNLCNVGMLRIRPGAGSQKSRYGVSWKKIGYQTKQVDQGDLGFEVMLEATASYVSGDLGAENKNAVPRTCAEDQWPMWVDVRGTVMEDVWRQVLAAAVGIISLRPGVVVKEIEGMLGGILTELELTTVLEYANEGGFVRPTRGGQGWETTESWWWCLGPPREDQSDLTKVGTR